jgi:hypothetical protein
MKNDNRTHLLDDPEATKKWLSLIFTCLGQLPSFGIATGAYSLSLYQPSIYQGKEPFLLVPLMVGLFATWTSLRWENAIWVIMTIFLLLSAFVYWVYDSFGPLSPIHAINWILSYCAVGLFTATLPRVVIDAIKVIDRK